MLDTNTIETIPPIAEGWGSIIITLFLYYLFLLQY